MPRYIDAERFSERFDMMCDAGGVLAPVTEAVREMVKKLIKTEPTVDNNMLDGYEQGYKDGLISATLKELTPMFEELGENLTNSITDIITKIVDGASLHINDAHETSMPIMFETEEFDAHGEYYKLTRPYCPACNYLFYGVFGDKKDCINEYRTKIETIPNYCCECGQALDWSEITEYKDGDNNEVH